MGLTPVAAGDLATVVTSLEMRQRPRPSPMPAAPLTLVKWTKPQADTYRALFRRVGGPWLWVSRLAMDNGALVDIIHDAAVSIWAVCDRSGIEVGLLELDFRRPGECEIAFFGLVPELGGKGFGRWLMAHALAAAWRPDVARVWLHTCTLDGPSALGFYIRSGFMPFARAVEVYPDPRLSGVYPPDCAPQIPLLAAESAR